MPFDLQGHRGARGLKPENTLPSFEVALDLGVSSIETDVHLTRDGVPVLIHDPVLSARLCRLAPGGSSPDPSTRPLVSGLTLAELRGYRADCNPDPRRFPEQNAAVTLLAERYAQRNGFNPYTPPTLADLLAFVKAYADRPGRDARKTEQQQARAGKSLRFDLEIKRVPFHPEYFGEDWDDQPPGLIEEKVVDAVRHAGLAPVTTVRSFDHRSVRAVRKLEPTLTTAVLIAGTAPVDPVALARQANASVYAPEVEFLDEAQVRRLHDEGIRVLPWTVNDPDDMRRLLDWGVDGITTDFPDRLAALLCERGILF